MSKNETDGATRRRYGIIRTGSDSCVGCTGDGCGIASIARIMRTTITPGGFIMTDGVINCGERTVQALYRVALQDICTAHGIDVGTRVEVWIKKVEAI